MPSKTACATLEQSRPASVARHAHRPAIHLVFLSPIFTKATDGRHHALSLAYFSRTSRLYSACTAFREICPFRSLAIFKRSGSVGARDFRLNLAKNLLAGPGELPTRLAIYRCLSSLAL